MDGKTSITATRPSAKKSDTSGEARLRPGAERKVSSSSASHAPGATYLDQSRPVVRYFIFSHPVTFNDNHL
jgi:hypothetical protein